MELFKPDTFAPTPLAVALAIGTALLALLLVQPDAHAAALALLRLPDTLLDAHVGEAVGAGAVRYWPVTLALVPAAVWAVRREVSRDQRPGR